MEVTRKNFKQTLPLVADSIEKADFLVIDAEFTGLMNGRDVSIFDSPEDYYYTLLNGASDFLLIQFGLCAFYWDEEVKHYMNDAYNFYLFPRGKPGPERMFLCQSSSLDFLAAQGFDFNKLIKEGISYMSEPCETRLRENLAERQKLYNNSESSYIKIPEENKQQIDDICKRVRQFLDDKKSDEMEIDRCNAFIRRLLFQELGTKFKNEAFVETKVLENKDRVLKVTRITSENESKDRDMQKKEKEWEEFEDAVGFSKVARMISQSEKLVIGHNMLLDLIHTLNHFFQPLPSDYNMFKEFAHCMFPKILDTKYMSSLPPFKDKVNSSVLSHLLATLSEPPFSLPKAESKIGRGYSQADDKAHEAGYDAYMTGLCFLAMLAHLSRMRGEQLGRAVTHTAALKPFLNKVFLAKTAHQDSPYMNLIGADPNPPRDHVFHLTFPKEWTRNDINQLFSPFCAVTLQFLDDTTAFVALSRREQARDVQRALSNNGRVTLVPYTRFKQPNKNQHQEVKDFRRSNTSLVNPITPESSPKPRPANSSMTKIHQKLPEKVERPHSDRRNLPEKVDRPHSDRQNLPEKVDRVQLDRENVLDKVDCQSERPRANSVSAAQPQPPPARKRTSSGVFQVDEAEPPPKKLELNRSYSEIVRKKPDVPPNGRRKNSESDIGVKNEKEKSVVERKKERIITKFDSEAKTKCVTAFEESDSWD